MRWAHFVDQPLLDTSTGVRPKIRSHKSEEDDGGVRSRLSGKSGTHQYVPSR